ncbi:hypothetical protein FA95DRAFT_1486558 [Auriscalpium vulgare]|uniref:Uncharacterized protein n=1 Tax=Auriscalpium vulgare TaxID=40419 RepID=A0ACB8S433_9AGAM|nr:hypothetical protein FA95DRAFT_1486558 [Auriscalpium vulgare]
MQRVSKLSQSFSSRIARRALSNSLPPAPPPSTLPPAELFDAPSNHPPKQYYARPKPRDLPPYRRTWPTLAALSLAGVSVWATFLMYSANQERLASSVMRNIMATVKEDPQVRDLLGEAVRPEPAWYLSGDPWVAGTIRMHQGNIDLSFRVKGHKDAGTLYFTSIRRSKGEPFKNLRFKIIADSGSEIHLKLP